MTTIIETTKKMLANDEDTIGSDTWNPTQKIFDHFIKRDFVLCNKNIRKLLTNNREPMTLRELKECLLHSHDVIVRALSSKVASGLIKEEQGCYFLAR